MVKEFRVATFNLENLTDSDAGAFNKRAEALRPMITRLKADLIFFQEVNKISALDKLLQGTDYDGWNKFYTTKDDGQTPLGIQNLVTVSKYELKDKKQYHNSLVGNLKWKKVTAIPPTQDAEDLDWPKPILYCKVKLGNNAQIHAINLHMKSMKPTNIDGQQDPQKDYLWKTHEGWAEGFFISAVKRLGQALETRVLLRDIFKQEPRALIVVAGDFNADVGSVPFRTITGSIQETNNPDIGHEVMVPCEMNVPEDRRYSLIHWGRGQMIDHVMVSKGLFAHWMETDIYNEILPDESIAFASDVKFPESDHAPIVAAFKLPDGFFI